MNLAAQLAPLDCAELRARLDALGDAVSDEDERRWRDEGGGGLARLRLVERLCAAHGEPIVGGVNAHDGNRTRDDSTRDAVVVRNKPSFRGRRVRSRETGVAGGCARTCLTCFLARYFCGRDIRSYPGTCLA